MPSIGESLREARMRQHLDISDVEAQTKIRAKYLRALEHEDFGLLPGPTFVKTFLRTYAEVLGLDPHVLVEEYRTTFEPGEEPEAPQPMGSPPPGRGERRPPPPSVVVAVLVVGLLAFLIVLGVTGGGDNGGSKPSAERTTPTGPKKPKRRKKALPAFVTLRMQPITPTYVCVNKGPGTPIVFQGILSAPQTFKAQKLRVNLGKASVRLQLNGKPFPTGAQLTPVGFEFSTKGSKPLPAAERPCA
ncbi:MAG: helix-turn-helix domain-containing protein [Thermoleophilaceae bacterium]